jgi:zinc protease
MSGHVRRRFMAIAVFFWLTAAGAGEPVESWSLEDGTTAVLVEDHRAPLVSLRFEFPAGSWLEWVRESHAVEAFRFQLEDPEGELRRRADRLAAGIGVSVSGRTSRLWASCLREDLDAVLDLVRDVLANRDYDRREIARSGREAKIGWKGALKRPSFRRGQAMARLVYAPSDPRLRAWERPTPLSSDPQRLAAARDRLLRLPGRVVALAGDVTRADVERAAAILPPIDADSPPVEPRLEALLAERPHETTVRIPRLTQVYFALVRDAIPFDHEDYPAWLVADHVLGGHFYSRLYVALRHEGGESYGAGTARYGDVAPGPYALTTYTRVDNAQRAEDKLREALARLRENGITEEERRAAIGYLRGRRAFRLQAPDQVLSRWLYERGVGLEPGFLDRQVERAAALSLEEIHAFAGRYFRPESFTLVRVAPE